MIKGDDVLHTLISLLEDQEKIKVTYTLGGDTKDETISSSRGSIKTVCQS